MILLYNVAIRFYSLLVRIAAIFNDKANLWYKGREDVFSYIKQQKSLFPSSKWIWIHAASLGEFEQARYLIETIATDYPKYKIALSFYSPSGYQARKNYAYADMVFYIPVDTPTNAHQTISTLNPSLAIFVKYDFWWNHLAALEQKNIPTVFISAMIRTDQYFIKRKLGKIRTILSKIDHFYVQNIESAKILDTIGIKQYTVTGDSRLDSIIHEQKPNLAIVKELDQWKGDRKCIIYGSIHLSDIPVVEQLLSLEAVHIIVPHDINDSNLRLIQSKLSHTPFYSDQGLGPKNTIILDTSGILRHIYPVADLVYIGGGFDKGIHNTLEPLVALKPIIIGPNYHKFPEAVELVNLDIMHTISCADEATDTANTLLSRHKEVRKKNQKHYIKTHSGATNKIIDSLIKNHWIK